MIELKPYRGTTASTVEKGDKTRLSGKTQTGKQAYPWHQNSTVSNYAACFFVALFAVSILLTIITQTPVWICGAVVLCIVSVYVINGLWQNYLNQYLGEPTLLVSTEHARRGEEIEVRFRQPVRRDLVLDNHTIELIAREWVRYKCGTDTCTDTYDLIIDKLMEERHQTIPANTAYDRRVTFTIPTQAMHSFAFADNSLTWLIRVTQQYSDFLTLTELYAIQVTPEIHTAEL